MNILILGGSGFIGQHLIAAISQFHNVRYFCRNKLMSSSLNQRVEFFEGNFLDNRSIRSALKDVDIVIHLISSTVPITAEQSPQIDVRHNLVPTIGLLQEMRESSVKKIIFLSSGGTVYGAPSNTPTKETAPLLPLNSYGIVKVAIESYIKKFMNEFNIDYIILRPSNVYGPGQRNIGKQGIINTFLNKIKSDQPIQVWNNGSVVRDYVYIDDLIEMLKLCIIPTISGVFNVGSGVGTSIKDLISTMKRVTNKNISIEINQNIKVDIPTSILDISLAKNFFGWSPKVSLEEGIRKSWESIDL